MRPLIIIKNQDRLVVIRFPQTFSLSCSRTLILKLSQFSSEIELSDIIIASSDFIKKITLFVRFSF